LLLNTILKGLFLTGLRRWLQACCAFFCFTLIGFSFPAAYAESPPQETTKPTEISEVEYQTPLAGDPYHPVVFGQQIDIVGRDRDNATALVLGATVFAPALAGQDFLPIGAFYMKRRWDDTRFRGIFSILVNESDVAKSFDSFQLLGHLDNNTIPFPVSEIAGGQEVKRTAIIWGTVNGRLGAGLRLPVHPFQADNDLRVQLFYQGSYLFSRRVEETGSNVVLPPNTLVHGPLLRVRYDGLRRNLLELPHSGVAVGMDVEFMRRDKWSDANYGGAVFPRNETRDYLNSPAI